MRDAGDLMNVQLQRLAHQQLVQASVFAQNEGVVQAGDQQNVVHAERHQIFEALELGLGMVCGIESGTNCHETFLRWKRRTTWGCGSHGSVPSRRLGARAPLSSETASVTFGGGGGPKRTRSTESPGR